MDAGIKQAGRWLIALLCITVVVGLQSSLAQNSPQAQLLPTALKLYLQNRPAPITLLPDGRFLSLQNSAIVLTTPASLANHTAAVIQRIALPQPRQFATATVLPDGRVLIWGGVDTQGQFLKSGLWLEFATNALTPVTDIPLLPRAGHTATVLSDGRVLVAGGWSPVLSVTPEAELWNPRSDQSQTVTNLPEPSRIGHTATLLADGHVALRSGVNLQGSAIANTSIFDPTLLQFSTTEANTSITPLEGVRPPTLATSIPATNATDFPADGLITLRFSEPMDMRSIDTKTITLVGPGGDTSVKVVGAEGGRLAFITPSSDLTPAAHYTLFLQGVTSPGNQGLPFTAIDFAVAVQSGTAGTNYSAPATIAASHESGAAATGISTSKVAVTAVAVGAASSPPPALHLMTGTNSSSAPMSLCTFSNGSIQRLCRPKSLIIDGAYYPGQDVVGDARNGRWRINTPDITPQEIANAVLMAHAKGASGSTGISGRIERIDGHAVANVDVSIGSTHVRTDARGDFSLEGVPAGHQTLYVDGTTANVNGHEYGQIVVGVNLHKGVILPLGYRMYLPNILARDKIRIPSPTTQDLVITHPDMPGLEIDIPAGTVIKDHKGKVVTELSLVPTPVDRAPYPNPVNFPVFFSLQPGGATILNVDAHKPQGITLTYPNYGHVPAGTAASFIAYEPDNGWHVYGKGAITPDGTQLKVEAGVHLTEVASASWNMDSTHPGDPKAAKPDGPCCGDPVDLNSGTLVENQTDVAINDIIPISLTRAWHGIGTFALTSTAYAQDTKMFGGWTSNYDMYVYSATGDWTDPGLGVRLSDGYLISPFTPITVQAGMEQSWQYSGTSPRYIGAILNAPLGTAICNNPDGSECYILTLRDGTSYWFDDFSGLYLIRDRFGNSVSLTKSGGLLRQITSPSGRYLSLQYDANNNVQNVTDNTGRTWVYSYHSDTVPVGGWAVDASTPPSSPPTTTTSMYFLDKVTYPDQTSTSFTYDENFSPPVAGSGGSGEITSTSCPYYRIPGTLLTMVDRNGNTAMANTYCSLEVTQETLADGSTYQFGYQHDSNDNTLQTSVTDPRGHVKQVAFDTNSGYPSSLTLAYGTPLAQTTTYTRNAYGQVTSMVDALARTTNFAYDANGNVKQITALAGTTSAVTQNSTYTPDYSQIATYTDGLGHTTTLTYTNGCLTGVKDALSHSTTIVCNDNGQPTSVKDALGHATTFGYQGYDLRTATDALSRTVTYTTDPLGRVTAISDPLGNVVLQQYDLNDHVAKLTDPLNQVTTLVTDPLGNLKSVTLPNTGIINYVYDSRNRLRQRMDAMTQSEYWTPDGMGNVVSHTDRKGQATAYQYDALDRRILTTYADSSTIVPTYDAGDRVTAISDSISGNQSFGYDGLDRLTTAVNPQATVSYKYDAANRRTTMIAGTQAKVTYTYDNANRITKLVQGSETVSLGYDNANRRNKLTLPNGVVVAYGYDNANELTGITYTQGSGTTIGNLVYGYDNGGRRTAQTGSLASNALPTATTQPSTFDFNDRLTTFNGNAQTYDADGNLTNDGTNTYVWNARNQLAQVKQGSAVIANYTYDALGRRASTAINGNTATTFLYDGLNPVQETQGATVTPILTGLGVDEFYARTEPTGRTYFLADAVGSTIGLTSTAGALVQSYQYDPYGEVTAQNSGFTNPYQYIGRENDGNGLYYYRARYYSPLMKRFVGEDSLGFGGGQFNFYAYANQNPMSYVDRNGKDPFLAVVGGGIGIGWGLINGYLAGDTGWKLAADAAAGGATGALIGLTDGLSLVGGIAARSAASMGIEGAREIVNGSISGCVHLNGRDIAMAGLSSVFGDSLGNADAGAVADDLSHGLHWNVPPSDVGAAMVGGNAAGAISSPNAALEGANSSP